MIHNNTIQQSLVVTSNNTILRSTNHSHILHPLAITNLSTHHLFFKIKTNLPQYLICKNSSSIIGPQEMQSCQLTINPKIPQDKRLKIQILWCKADLNILLKQNLTKYIHKNLSNTSLNILQREKDLEIKQPLTFSKQEMKTLLGKVDSENTGRKSIKFVIKDQQSHDHINQVEQLPTSTSTQNQQILKMREQEIRILYEQKTMQIEKNISLQIEMQRLRDENQRLKSTIKEMQQKKINRNCELESKVVNMKLQTVLTSRMMGQQQQLNGSSEMEQFVGKQITALPFDKESKNQMLGQTLNQLIGQDKYLSSKQELKINSAQSINQPKHPENELRFFWQNQLHSNKSQEESIHKLRQSLCYFLQQLIEKLIKNYPQFNDNIDNYMTITNNYKRISWESNDNHPNNNSI